MKHQLVLISIALLVGFAITAAAANSEGPLSIARIPGSVLFGVFWLRILFPNSMVIFWSSNILFWGVVVYGCLSLFLLPFQKESTLPKSRLYKLAWLCPVILFVFVVFALTARYTYSFYEAILAKPAESIWCPCSSFEYDSIILANVVFWSTLIYGVVLFISKLRSARNE